MCVSPLCVYQHSYFTQRHMWECVPERGSLCSFICSCLGKQTDHHSVVRFVTWTGKQAALPGLKEWFLEIIQAHYGDLTLETAPGGVCVCGGGSSLMFPPPTTAFSNETNRATSWIFSRLFPGVLVHLILECAVNHAAVIYERTECKWLPKLLREEVPSRIELNGISSDSKIVYMA